jgi:hypothetical protein
MQGPALLGGGMATHRADDGLVGVERAGAKVALNDPERRQRPRGGDRAVCTRHGRMIRQVGPV